MERTLQGNHMLKISYSPMRVFVDNARMQRKVAPVLALMAVRAKQYPPEQAWVSAAEVALLPDWHNSKPKSVGTEVYNALRRLGLQRLGLVESPHLGKVTKWRFKASITVEWRPDFETVASAVAADVAQITVAQNHNPIGNTSVKLIDLADELSRVTTEPPGGRDAALKKLSEWYAPQCLIEKRKHPISLSGARSLTPAIRTSLQQGESSTEGAVFAAADCIANAKSALEEAKCWLMTAIPLLLAHGAQLDFDAALFDLSVTDA